MKWGIIILLILGAVAAASAALLIGAMRTDSSAAADKNSPSDVEVVTAKISIPAMTVVTLEHVTKEKISNKDLPPGAMTNSTKVIGRVLSVPVVEGQILTESCFVTTGTGAQLAAALPHGMRAVTVNLSRSAIPDQALLYPGCVVDVLVSFRLSRTDEGQAISTTMLRGIQVLAVAGDSVVSNPNDEDKKDSRARRTSSGAAVTLMVDPKQAEALQLAAGSGSISLAIRNPLDRNMFDIEGTVLSQGRLAHLGSVLTSAVFSAGQNEQKSLAEQILSVIDLPQQSQGEGIADPNLFTKPQPPKPNEEYQVRRSPRWGVTVIRGRESKIEELAIPENEDATGVVSRK